MSAEPDVCTYQCPFCTVMKPQKNPAHIYQHTRSKHNERIMLHRVKLQYCIQAHNDQQNMSPPEYSEELLKKDNRTEEISTGVIVVDDEESDSSRKYGLEDLNTTGMHQQPV